LFETSKAATVEAPVLAVAVLEGTDVGSAASVLTASAIPPAADTEAATSRGPRQAHLEGLDLHANVRVAGNDRAALERLCRYILRPPFAQERLRLRSDGRVALELKQAWYDRTRELVFEPLELLERLAAMTPRPETNLLICHGLLAARARWRARWRARGGARARDARRLGARDPRREWRAPRRATRPGPRRAGVARDDERKAS
jgi:hypothetical protein